MASSMPNLPVPRRSASLPVQKPSGADPQTEILYTLPLARIVQFKTSGSISKRASFGGDTPVVEEEAGTLSWVSRFERTIAVGPFRIYRAPGSVAFLNCQNALRPILPKSQCWVVDDNASKFVLQVKKPDYWRIEVPNDTPEEKRRTEELKEVLGTVLLFEKTPCPFRRSFVVALPETPKTPIRKRPWKPVESPKVEPELRDSTMEMKDVASVSANRRFFNPSIVLEEGFDPMAPSDDISNSLATVSEVQSREGLLDPTEVLSAPPLERNIEVNSDDSFEESLRPLDPISSSPNPILESSVLGEDSVFADFTGLDEDGSYSDVADITNITPKGRFHSAYPSMTVDPGKENRVQQPLQHCSRSMAAPPVLSLVTSPPSKHRTKFPLRNPIITESNSEYSSSVESFHTVQSWHSPLTAPSPSPPASSPSSPVFQYPYPHENIILPKRPVHHSRDVSELTITPDTPRVWEVNPSSQPSAVPGSRSISPPPKTPTLMPSTSTEKSDSEPEILTPPTVRHRATTSSNSRRRELSPLPAAVNLFSPRRRRPRHLQTARHLPTAIVQKTWEVLLSPPSHLLNLMISIASKIAAGEWRGVLSGQGESVHWDFEDEYVGVGWGEDDFGISLPAARSKAKGKKAVGVNGGSWEVD